MNNPVITRRYGDAYMSFIKDGLGYTAASLEFKNIHALAHENPGFLEFLNAPDIGPEQKNAFIDKVLGGDYSPEFCGFLKLLVEKGRLDQLLDIAEYIRVAYSYGEEVEALVRTGFMLDTSLLKTIKERLQNKFKKKFKLYVDLDGSLIGGIQVVMGNTVIDGTIRKRLNDLKEKLMTVRA